MPLCSNRKSNNFSFLFASIEMENNRLYYRLKDESWPRGKYADLFFYRFFLEDPEVLRSNGRCSFIYADSVGNYFPANHSYNGAIGLTVEGKVDAFIRPMDFYSIDQSLVDYSDVLLSIAYHPFQLINQKNPNEKSLTKTFGFLVPSLSFLLIFVFSLLFYLVSLFASLKSTNCFASRPIRKFKSLRSQIISISLFMFFIRNFFSNNLNTSTVILDFSDLLYSIEQLLQTNKEFCFLERSIEYEYMERSPENSLVRKIYDKRARENLCFLSVNARPGNLLNRDLQKIFLLLPDLNLKLTSRVIQALVKKDTFIGEQMLYEILRAFVVKKNLDKRMLAFLNRFVQSVMQFGLHRKLAASIPNWTVFDLAKEGGRDGYMTYLSLAAFIEENTFIGPLPFNKLDYFFRAYLALQGALLFANLFYLALHSSSPFAKMWMKTRAHGFGSKRIASASLND